MCDAGRTRRSAWIAPSPEVPSCDHRLEVKGRMSISVPSPYREKSAAVLNGRPVTPPGFLGCVRWGLAKISPCRPRDSWLPVSRSRSNGWCSRLPVAADRVGQNVNKVETKVVARLPMWALADRLDPGAMQRVRQRLANRITDADELMLTSSVTRSRQRNIEDALDRLCEMVARALVRPRRRRPTRPTAGSRRRRLEAKKQRGELKQQRRRPPTE